MYQLLRVSESDRSKYQKIYADWQDYYSNNIIHKDHLADTRTQLRNPLYFGTSDLNCDYGLMRNGVPVCLFTCDSGESMACEETVIVIDDFILNPSFAWGQTLHAFVNTIQTTVGCYGIQLDTYMLSHNPLFIQLLDAYAALKVSDADTEKLSGPYYYIRLQNISNTAARSSSKTMSVNAG